MKNFKHQWDNEIFLLHLQFDNLNEQEACLKLSRIFSNQETVEEIISIPQNTVSHRFIVSRSKPQEQEISVDYPTDVVLEAFLIDDRAYYPTESFYRE
jgi:hypothetical protein